MAADARRAGQDRLVPSRLAPDGGQPLRVRAPVAEAERVGRAHPGVALAEGAGVDGDEQALLEREAEVVAAARADEEPPFEDLLVVDLPAARALLPRRRARLGRRALDLAHAVRADVAAPMALLSPPTKLATRAGASRSPSSSRRASALPTMTASAKPAIQAACSGRETPKPTPSGSVIPAASARAAERWRTGPSAIGSENGTPSSITSAPSATAARTRSRVVGRSGSPAVKYGTSATWPRAPSAAKVPAMRLTRASPRGARRPFPCPCRRGRRG